MLFWRSKFCSYFFSNAKNIYICTSFENFMYAYYYPDSYLQKMLHLTTIKIHKGLFAYNIMCMTKPELIAFCAKKGLVVKTKYSKSHILNTILNDRRQNTMKTLVDSNTDFNTVLYPELLQLILSFMPFDDDLDKTRKQELLKYKTISAETEFSKTVCRSDLIDWFVKHQYDVSPSDLETINIINLRILYRDEVRKSHFLSVPLQVIAKTKSNRKKYLMYLKYPPNERSSLLSLRKKEFEMKFKKLLEIY